MDSLYILDLPDPNKTPLLRANNGIPDGFLIRSLIASAAKVKQTAAFKPDPSHRNAPWPGRRFDRRCPGRG